MAADQTPSSSSGPEQPPQKPLSSKDAKKKEEKKDEDLVRELRPISIFLRCLLRFELDLCDNNLFNLRLILV